LIYITLFAALEIVSLTSRINEKFFGFKVNQALSNLTKDERNSFERNAINFLSSCISYLEK